MPHLVECMAKRTALFYLLVGMLWIIFSDLAVEALVPDIHEAIQFNIAKGLFFVGFTAALLYFFVYRLEQQREKHDQNYRKLFADNPNAMLLIRKADGAIVSANEAACQLYGYTHAEFRTLRHSVLETNAERFGSIKQLKQHRNKAGEIVWVKEFISEVEQGHTSYFLHLIVSAHEAAEADALRMAAQERLERLMHGMPDMVLGINTAGKINFCNPALLAHLGYNEKEVIDADALELLRKCNGDWWEDILVNSWQQSRFITEKFYPARKKWFRVSSYQSADGLGMLISDISQQHLLEDALNQFQVTLEAVVNASDDQIWAIDHEYRLLASNKQFQLAHQSWGHSLNEGESLLEQLGNKPGFEPWKVAYEQAIAGEKVECMVADICDPAGPPVIDLRMYPIKNDQGEVLCVGCFAHNASRRLLHEQEINEQREKLLHIAWQQSHEMRAPLANVMGISQLLQTDAHLSRDELLDLLSKLDESTAQLDAIIRNIVAQSSHKQN